MWQNAHDIYMEDRVLSAGPVELVYMLYQACTGAVGDARRHLASGDILVRSRAISKACEILLELTSSLNHEQGGDLSQRLAALYGYMSGRLLDANIQQDDAPLAEVAGLLATLTEGWEGIVRETRPTEATPEGTPWMQAIPQGAELAHASGSWSF